MKYHSAGKFRTVLNLSSRRWHLRFVPNEVGAEIAEIEWAVLFFRTSPEWTRDRGETPINCTNTH